jgi:hypothetical protein
MQESTCAGMKLITQRWACPTIRSAPRSSCLARSREQWAARSTSAGKGLKGGVRRRSTAWELDSRDDCRLGHGPRIPGINVVGKANAQIAGGLIQKEDRAMLV